MNKYFICAFLAGSLLFAGDKKPQPDARQQCMDKCKSGHDNCLKRATKDADRKACETRLTSCRAGCPK
ncbi:MAG: hypothetical protein HY821_17015 [Acidobacteria bacterium]|nr:hypothetical protein [Acidobacteriota bacterium]